MRDKHTAIDGIHCGPLAALVGTWTGDKMRHPENAVLDICGNKSFDHRAVNSLSRAS